MLGQIYLPMSNITGQLSERPPTPSTSCLVGFTPFPTRGNRVVVITKAILYPSPAALVFMWLVREVLAFTSFSETLCTPVFGFCWRVAVLSAQHFRIRYVRDLIRL